MVRWYRPALRSHCGWRRVISGNQRLDERSFARGLRQLADRDKYLGAVLSKHGPPALRLRRPGFEALICLILEQQVSVASGRAVRRKLSQLSGGITAGRISALGEKQLLKAGLSRQKARYCCNLARVVANGELRLNTLHRHNDDACREILMHQPGIGRWTADVYLLTALGRPDVWPAGDLALRISQAETLGLGEQPSHDESDALAVNWRPWRSVAARILWHNYRMRRQMP